MLCNGDEFQRFVSTNLLIVILLVMQIARLIKTTSTNFGRIDCVTSRKNICENTKRSQANREAKIYRFISHIKGPLFRSLLFFSARSHAVQKYCTDGQHFVTKNRLFFGIVYAFGARTYSVVTSFRVLVDSTLGHKTSLLPLHKPIFSETISGQRCTVLDKKKKEKTTLFLWLELTRQATLCS